MAITVAAPRKLLVKAPGRIGLKVAVFSVRVLENFKPGSMLMAVLWVRVGEGCRLVRLLCMLAKSGVAIKIFDMLP